MAERSSSSFRMVRAKLETAKHPAAIVIDCANRGYGAAVNLGVSRSQARCFLALNADLTLKAGFLEQARRLAEELLQDETRGSRIGIAGGALFDSAGHRQGSFGPWPTLIRLLLGLFRPRPVRRYWPPTTRFRDVPGSPALVF